MKVFSILAIAALTATPAHAQEKVEIQVSNSRTQAFKMRFSYAFRNATWDLMERDVSPGSDITYRFPSNIPGCEKLHEWGIADGVLSIEEKSEVLCQMRVSLCDKSILFMDVQQGKCEWRRSP